MHAVGDSTPDFTCLADLQDLTKTEQSSDHGAVSAVEATAFIPLGKQAVPERDLSQYRLSKASSQKCMGLGVAGGALAGALIGGGAGLLAGLPAGPAGIVTSVVGGVAGAAIGTGVALKRIFRPLREEIKIQISKAERGLNSTFHKQQENAKKIKASWNKLLTEFDFTDEKGFRRRHAAEKVVTNRLRGELNDLSSKLADIRARIEIAEEYLDSLIGEHDCYISLNMQRDMQAAFYHTQKKPYLAQAERNMAAVYRSRIDHLNESICAERARLAGDSAYQALCNENRDLSHQESAKKTEYEQQCARAEPLNRHRALLLRRKQLRTRGCTRAKVRAQHYENHQWVLAHNAE